MSENGPKKQKQYRMLNQRTFMKFIPKNYSINLQQNNGHLSESGFSYKLKKLMSLGKKQVQANYNGSTSSYLQNSQSSLKDSSLSLSSAESRSNNKKSSTLKYFESLNNQHFLIGNQYQLDIIRILGISSDNYVDTQLFTSLSFDRIIDSVAVDNKKNNMMVICTDKKILIYDLEQRLINIKTFENPYSLKLSSNPQKIVISRNGLICVFFEKYGEILEVQQGKVINTIKIHYKSEQKEFKKQLNIFQIPKPLQNSIYVFLRQDKKYQNTFVLWVKQIQLIANQVNQKPLRKIHQISKNLMHQSSIKIFDSQTFLFICKNQVSAMRHGYVIDTVSVNQNIDNSVIKCLNEHELFHLTNHRIEFYDYQINTKSKPNKFNVTAKDSLQILDNMSGFRFEQVIQFQDDYLFLYQIDPIQNKNKSGEILYSFYLTYRISQAEKINDIFDSLAQTQNFKIDSQQLIEKCDMAKKMGLTNKQIFLELWKRSSKSKVQDYQLLLSVQDFETIKEEVLKKLRKTSMTFNEIKNIYSQCLFMLKKKIFDQQQCSCEYIFQYIHCHFFMRKLNMFKDMYLFKSSEKGHKLKISIQNYQDLNSLHITDRILSLVEQYCNQKHKQMIQQIRFILSNFKFVLRTIYWDLLEGILGKSGQNLLMILKKMPEILPYKAPLISLEENIPIGFYEGVWSQINARQWEQSLYYDKICNFQNREIIEDAIKDINFKRNFLSKHDLVIWSKQEINNHQKMIYMQQTFYFFIAKMLQKIKNVTICHELINFMEHKYDMFPGKIKGQIMLRFNIYSFLKQKNILPSKAIHLQNFLQLQDYELISHLFAVQKDIKGLILRNIKPIYEQVCGEQKGLYIFNKSIANYFKTDLSSISDLKYILNRINHRKLQFHKKNQSFYQVILESLQRKMLVGSTSDIPISQVMIYIEKIPWYNLDNQSDHAKGQIYLKQTAKIESETKLLKQAKINLSIYDIIHTQDIVISRLVTYLYEKNKVSQIKDYKQVQQITIEIVSRLKQFSKAIYQVDNSDIILFFYLCKLCQQIQNIRHTKKILQNPELKDWILDQTPQNVVAYIYRKKMIDLPIMIKHCQYVKQLITILAQDNIIRKYIQTQSRLVQIISSKNFTPEYPISSNILTQQQLKNMIFCADNKTVLNMNLQQLHQICVQLQTLAYQTLKQTLQPGVAQLEQPIKITIKQIYQICILKLLDSRMIKQALKMIKQFLMLQKPKPEDTIYAILFISKISQQFNQDNQRNILLLIFYYFNRPLNLMEIMEIFCEHALSSREVKEHLAQAINVGKKQYFGFNKQNQLFEQDLNIQTVTDPEMLQIFMKNIIQAGKHLEKSKQIFKQFKFMVLLPILCNAPFSLAKYLSSGAISISAIRCYLSYIIQVDIFNSLTVLEMGRRICLMLLLSEKKSLNCLINDYSFYDYNSQIQLLHSPYDANFSKQSQMWRSAQAFQRKKIIYQKELEKKSMRQSSSISKSQRLKRTFSDLPDIQSQQPYKYPFQQSDNDNYVQEQTPNNKIRHFKSLNVKEELSELNLEIKQKKKSLLFSKKSISPVQSPKLKVKKVSRKSSALSNEQMFSEYSGADKSYQSAQNRLIFKQVQPSKQASDETPPQLIKLIVPQIIQYFQDMKSTNNQDNAKQTPTFQKQIYRQQSVIQSPEDVQNQRDVKTQKVQQTQNQCKNFQALHSLTSQFIKLNIEKIKSKQISTSYNMLPLKDYYLNKNKIRQICQQVYKISQVTINEQTVSIFTHQKLNMIKQIIKFQVQNQKQKLGVQKSFGFLLKILQLQQKIVKDIDFMQILEASDLFDNYYDNKNLLIQKIYPKLKQKLEVENVHEIGLFLSRAFSKPDLKAQIMWDFLMKTATKIDKVNQKQQQMIVEMIQASLPKVNLRIWIKNFKIFEETMSKINNKSQLMKVFYEYLEISTPKQQAIQFLQLLVEAKCFTKAIQILQQLKK